MTLQEWCDEFAAWASSEENAFGVDDPDRVLGILLLLDIARSVQAMPYLLGQGALEAMTALEALEAHAAGGAR